MPTAKPHRSEGHRHRYPLSGTQGLEGSVVELHDDVGTIVVLAGFEHGDDVGMA